MGVEGGDPTLARSYRLMGGGNISIESYRVSGGFRENKVNQSIPSRGSTCEDTGKYGEYGSFKKLEKKCSLVDS